MITRFTADDAFDARDAGDPITISHDTADRICREHGASLLDFLVDLVGEQNPHTDDIDAADLLQWLGY